LFGKFRSTNRPETGAHTSGHQYGVIIWIHSFFKKG
jgi:hypothetical protein